VEGKVIRGNCGIATLLALLAFVSACAERRPERITKITVTGELAEGLELVGRAHAAASRDSIFCRNFSMVWGTFSEVRREAKEAVSRRIAPNRYTLVLDLEDMPYGGFCRWELTGFGVLAHREGASYDGAPVLVMSLDDSPAEQTRSVPQPGLDIEKPHSSSCARQQLVRCQERSGTFSPFEGEGTFHLNVSWAEEDEHE
jgi:hypothetical protein